jgi:glycosyltransferase involved in cell wall biosynthesis
MARTMTSRNSVTNLSSTAGSESPRLSVIIPFLNAAHTIAAQLEALVNQSWPEPWELLVADNGSQDDSIRIIQGYAARLPNLRVVDASDRPGAAHARNVGARHASASTLVFCDADDEVGENWLAAMAAALTVHDFVACRIDVAKLNRGWVQHPQEYGLQELWYPPYLPVAGGCGLGVKRRLHEAVGGFDETMRGAVVEDSDYCVRIQQQGVPLVFVHDAVLHYRTRQGTGMTFRQARRWAAENVLLYKRYRGEERVRRPWKRYWSGWPRLLRRFATARGEAELREAIGKLGWQLGLLLGSLKYRTTPVP